MAELFQNVLTASFHGSIVIVVVLLLRLALKKTPKKFLCFLWLLAGIRLLMPFEIRSDLSLQPEVEEIPYVAEIRQETPQSVSEIRPQLSDYPVLPASPDAFASPEFIPEGYYEVVLGQTEPEEITRIWEEKETFDWKELIPWLWLAVACCFGVYTLFSYVTLKVRVRDAIKIPGGWESDRIETAFILGFIRPQIYIPMGMPGSVRKHILAHERTHLEKGDHWFKMIGFIALAIHWFNPLVWVAYILLCKDIELACDERVVQFMDLEDRKRYSAALLTCSANKAHFAACPVAFGEVSVKERIKSVLNYKKPGFWISLLGVIAILFVAVCLVTSPAEEAVSAEETAEATTAVNVVHVKNPDELLAAIAPDTEIVMEAGTYILSEASDYGQMGNEYYTWMEVYDGWQLTLTGVENLTIRGSGHHVTVIETYPRYASVIVMQNCANVLLEDVTAGHTVEPGVCSGGVVSLSDCENITMNRVGLYGCGTIGLETNGCENITLTESDVYECSNAAAYLIQSHDVTVSGCRIYRIGDETYGGYTFFQISNSSNVVIENNELSDSTLNCLMSTGSSTVDLKNNLFTNNRPQSCVFSGQEICITMDGNRFEGNSIRNWYEWEATARNKFGNILTEEDLHALYGTAPEPTEPKEPQLEIHVSTVDELIAAIGPNKDIVLDAEAYDLSTATGYGTTSGDYFFWEDIFDGPGLVIQNVTNMTIRTATGDRNRHTISAVPRYADVLQFKACDNITLSSFTAGHTLEPGSCAGGVLEFHDSDAITVDNCGLFGCGILGVQADYCSDITVKNTEIYECSQGGVNLWNVDGITLTDVTFRDIGGNSIIYISQCKNVTIDGEKVIGETESGYHVSTPEQEKTHALNAVVNDFAMAWLAGEVEAIEWHLASGYTPEPWTGSSEAFTMWFEAFYSHVQELQKAGSMVFEVPFRDGFDTINKDPRYLLVTVIEEDGAFKVSDCRVKE